MVVVAVIIDGFFVVGEGGRGWGVETKEINQVLT